MKQYKTYRAGTIISINLYSEKIGNKRIVFNESGRGGVFSTDDEDIQEALEKSSRFGDMYVLDAVEQEQEAKEIVEEPEEVEERKVTVTSITEAKDFLCENYDYTRSSLRSKESIVKAGAAHNIIFEGL